MTGNVIRYSCGCVYTWAEEPAELCPDHRAQPLCDDEGCHTGDHVCVERPAILPKRPSIRQLKVLKRVQHHGPIIRTMNAERGSHYALMSGEVLDDELVNRYAASGWLVREADGLFADIGQTLRVTPGMSLEPPPKKPRRERRRASGEER